MRHHLARRLVVPAIALLALVGGAPAASADPLDLAAARRQADAWMAGPLRGFAAAKALAPPPFDWSDDGCSVVPDHPLGFTFTPACERHDFGYRNYGRGLRLDPTEGRRARIDRRFRSDLLAICRAWRPVQLRAACVPLALAYYEGVRRFGASAFGS